jgi:hypothetical protein
VYTVVCDLEVPLDSRLECPNAFVMRRLNTHFGQVDSHSHQGRAQWTRRFVPARGNMGSDVERQWTRTFIPLHDQSGRGTTAEGAFKSRGQPDKKAKHTLLGESPDYRACDLVASRYRVLRRWLALCLHACQIRWSWHISPGMSGRSLLMIIMATVT